MGLNAGSGTISDKRLPAPPTKGNFAARRASAAFAGGENTGRTGRPHAGKLSWRLNSFEPTEARRGVQRRGELSSAVTRPQNANWGGFGGGAEGLSGRAKPA